MNGIDIMGPELVVVDIGRKRVILGSCDVEVPIEIKFHFHSAHGVIRPIHAQKTTVVPPHLALPVCIYHLHQIPADRDYLIEPGNVNFGVYAHMVNSETSTVLVQNDSHNSLHVPLNFRLGHIVELEYPNASTAEPTQLADLALRQPKSHHKASWFRKLVTAYAAIASPNILLPVSKFLASSDAPVLHDHTSSFTETKSGASTLSEVKLFNGVIIHNSGKNTVQELTAVVEEFLQIWKNLGFAELSEKNWMRIPLKTGWEEKLKSKAKVYPLGTRDREFVDKIFDELHGLGRMSWTTASTPFSYPCFVV